MVGRQGHMMLNVKTATAVYGISAINFEFSCMKYSSLLHSALKMEILGKICLISEKYQIVMFDHATMNDLARIHLPQAMYQRG